MRGSFGHGLLFLPFSCQNQGFIRTRIALFNLFVSESGAHSDTDCSFLPFGVRIRGSLDTDYSLYPFRVRVRGSFGHELLFFSFSCPNQGLELVRITTIFAKTAKRKERHHKCEASIFFNYSTDLISLNGK
jgi:hypothetical protein